MHKIIKSKPKSKMKPDLAKSARLKESRAVGVAHPHNPVQPLLDLSCAGAGRRVRSGFGCSKRHTTIVPVHSV